MRATLVASLVFAFLLGSSVLAGDAAAAKPAKKATTAKQPRAAKPTEPEPEDPGIDPIIVGSTIVEPDVVIDALELRLPGRTFVGPGSPRPEPSDSTAFVRVQPRGDDATELELILGDGRAFYRPLPATVDEIPREAATTLANLLAGIEAGRVEADAIDVPIPEAEAQAQAEVAPAPTPILPKVLEPDAELAAPSEPRLDIGWAVAPGIVLGLGPPSAPGLAAGGAVVDLDLRLRSGFLATGGVRAVGLVNRGFGLARIRISLGAGYVYRTEVFELLTALEADVEPWLVRTAQAGVERLDTGSESAPAAVVFGGHLRLVPAYRFAPSARNIAVRIGPRFEISGSATTAAGGGVARVRTYAASGAPIDVFRVGGLELGLGMELGMWFGIR